MFGEVFTLLPNLKKLLAKVNREPDEEHLAEAYSQMVPAEIQQRCPVPPVGFSICTGSCGQWETTGKRSKGYLV